MANQFDTATETGSGFASNNSKWMQNVRRSKEPERLTPKNSWNWSAKAHFQERVPH